MGELNGDYVRSRRLECGLSQDGFADLFGVKRQTVMAWEAGRHPVPLWWEKCHRLMLATFMATGAPKRALTLEERIEEKVRAKLLRERTEKRLRKELKQPYRGQRSRREPAQWDPGQSLWPDMLTDGERGRPYDEMIDGVDPRWLAAGKA